MSERMNGSEDPYLCVGICMADPDSGYCLGCGRPPLPSGGSAGAVVAEAAPGNAALAAPPAGDPDTPAAGFAPR